MRSSTTAEETIVQTARRWASRGGMVCVGLALTAACLGLQCPGQTMCATDEDCDNGMFCDGAETCDTTTMVCVDGTAPCTEAEVCVEADDACVACAEDADCDDGDACTTDTCDTATGCSNTPIMCDTGQTCVDGQCVTEGGGGDPAAGETFFMDNGCAACHGADASGGFGPSLHGVSASEIFDKLSGATSHVGGTVAGVTQQDADNLAAWFASL